MKKFFLLFIVLFLNIPATQGAAALERQSYEGAVTFPADEYQAYRERIEKLNPEIHTKLKHYKDVFHNPAFLKAADLKSATVLIPTQKSHGQPMMVLPSDLSDEELERYLASYKALTKRFIPEKWDFPDAEYQHYMNLIKEIDNTLYQNLLKFELLTTARRISKPFHDKEHIHLPDALSPHGQVTIKSMLDKTEEEQKDHLKGLLEKAAKYKPECEKQRERITSSLKKAAKNNAEYLDSDDAELPESKAARYDDEIDEYGTEEYEEYMKLIADIDYSVYEKFREYENSPGYYPEIITLSPYSTLDTLDGIRILPGAMIIPPHESNKWHPIIIMEPMYGLSETEKIEKLTQIIKKFSEVVKKFNHFVYTQRARTAAPFPPDEYREYMRIIETLDQSVYKNLTACEEKLGGPCVRVREGKMSEIILPSDETHGYPIILLDRDIEKCPTKKDYLERVIQNYKQVLLMTHEERTKILGIIKNLAPELYTELVTVDPTGKNHIIRGNDTEIDISSKDGLPLFIVSYSNAMELPEDQLRWILGHELSHYVQDDYEDFYGVPPTHKAMKGNETLPQEYAPGKKISGQLPFEETFKKARSRTKEYGADAGSVMRFSTNIDAAIAWLKNQGRRREEEYKIANQPLTTFTTTHPLNKDRIAHLESLRNEDEVERRKANEQEPAPIDWKALIEEHKKNRKQAVQWMRLGK